jgi:hypothetical protein
MNTTITVNPAKLQATLEARPQGKGINLAGIVRVPYRMKAFTAVTIHTDATVDCEKDDEGHWFTAIKSYGYCTFIHKLAHTLTEVIPALEDAGYFRLDINDYIDVKIHSVPNGLFDSFYLQRDEDGEFAMCG